MRRGGIIDRFVHLCLVLACAWSAHAQGMGPNSFSLIEQKSDSWRIEYVPTIPPPVTIEVDGAPHLLFPAGSAALDGEPGKPQLPVEAITLGVSEGTDLRVDLVDPQYFESQNQLVAPIPTYALTDDKEAVPSYEKGQTFYSENRYFPLHAVTIESPYIIRQQRMITVRFFPYQYNPATRVLRRLMKTTVTIRMIPSGDHSLERTSSPASPDPQFEHMYRGLMFNYEQAKQWRGMFDQQRDAGTPDPTRDWFETGRTYYRIPVAHDGWYKVTKADLAAAGANTSQIDVNTLKVFEKGREIPVTIRPDTTTEFYAVRNYGDSTYLDFYTDTSTYWMTWGGGTLGLRFAPEPQHSGNPATTVTSAPVTRHFEQNNWYYAGTVNAELIETEAVPGEGWAWGTAAEWFYQNTTRSFSFLTDAVDRGFAQARLRARLFGTTSVSPPVDSRARFWVNDSLVGDVVFPQRTEGYLNTSIPTTFLRDDSGSIDRLPSQMTVTSIPTIPGVNQFFLDWFEIDYQRNLLAQNGQLLFESPQSSGPNPALFTVSGFPNSQIDVFDLTGGRHITGGTVSGDSTGFTVSFKDTFTTSKKYLVVCAGAQLAVPPLTQKQFTDIRINPPGADYLIISHRLFRSAAERLKAERQGFNGVRARIVFVDEIYDEFNYGVKNATVIKNFLRHAYLNWAPPRLAYVLMFGDACWDHHRFISSTTQTDFVPSYGFPVGDNWFGCFNPDSSFIPALLIGRLPARDSTQAEHAVSKVIGYDTYTLDDWNKNFLMITGGNNSGEQDAFNILSNIAINTYISPPPIGGTAFRVYKSSTAYVDGENKQLMRNLVRDGLVYVNFLGHSGGALWGVDIGNPNTLENTNGRLPFLSSVSCNVGAFGDPYRTMLAEEFVLADNRGSIASWASTGLGYPSPGASLNQYFLIGVSNGVRDLGSLTTTARLRLWQTFGNDYVTVGMVKTNPLLGDPLTKLAIPLMPDLAVKSQDIAVNIATPTPNDSVLTIKVGTRNFGLVPGDSVGVTVTDTYAGQSTELITNKKFRRTLHRDTLYVPWDAAAKVGRHTIAVTLDPTHAIAEISEANNIASVDQYVYANLLAVVKPFNNMVVPAGPQTLVVSSPLGLDSVGFQYFFELDTVATFDSPFRVSSGPVTPGPVSGVWITPSLPNNQAYFWRARTQDDTLQGNWVVASFSTSSSLPVFPLNRWRQNSPRQFARERLTQAVVTDSGVTIARTPISSLAARSYGTREPLPYSFNSIILNDIVVRGYTYVIGYSIMAMRVNEFNGAYDVGGGIGSVPWHPDSVLNFIRNTPVGNYVAFISMAFAGPSFNESVYVAVESLGSTRVRQVQPGQAWAFIGRKGFPSAALEVLTNDSAIVSLQIPNPYSLGSGSITTTGVSIPTSWDSMHWRHDSSPPATKAQVAFLGIRHNGAVDTLRILPADSIDVSLAFLNSLTSGPTYASLRLAGLLTTSDAVITPVLRDWWMDLNSPADLAVSSRTIGLQDLTIQKGAQLNLPVTVHNIGFRGADSARVVISVFDRLNKARPIASAMLDTIPVNGTQSTTIPLSTVNFSRRMTLEVNVSPSKKQKDLVPDNNVAYYTFNVVGGAGSGIRLFADGIQLMDGDYVAAKPTLVVRLPRHEEGAEGFRQTELFVDNKLVITPAASLADEAKARIESDDDLTFSPELSNGVHELMARTVEFSSMGGSDTLEQSVRVHVLDKMQILQPYVFPNPFSRDTYFTFILTGNRPPEELTIRIFTVAGRRIREIVVRHSQLQVGFNRVYWDGRDADGDELANGYYFYQLTVKGEGRTETSVEKLVKLR